MKVCVVGSGGREHALALALARTAEVVVTPGNPGMAASREGITDRRADARPRRSSADLLVIGPEQPLVDGLADRLRADGRLVFGPGRRRCPPRGLEGLHEGGPGRGAGAHGALRASSTTLARRRRVPARAPRTVGGEDRRPRRRQGRARHRLGRRGRGRRGRQAVGRALRRRRPAGGGGGGAARARVLAARALRRDAHRRRWPRPRTSSASATATTGPNTGGMGSYSPGAPWSTTGWSTALLDEAVEPRRGRAAPARHRLPRRALRRAHPHRRRARRCSSTTSASATPRPRWCCPGSTRTSPACWPRRPPATCAPSRAPHAGARGVRGAGVGGVPRGAPRTGDVIDGRRRGRHPRGGHRPPRRDRRWTPRATSSTAGGRVLGRDRHRRRPWPRPGTGPTPGWRRIGWPGMQYRTDIAARAALDEGAARSAAGSRDPPLLAAGDGGAVHRRGPARRGGSRWSSWPSRAGPSVGEIPGRARRRRARARPQGDARARGRRRRPGEGHRPRRGRLRRRRPGGHRPPGGVVGPLRAHLVRRGGHRAVRHPDARRRPAARRLGRPGGGAQDAGRRSSSLTPMAGRTHGMHAEPTTFGAKLALWCLQADRDRRRLRAARRRRGRGQAVGGGGDVLEHRPRGRGLRVPGARARRRCPPPR